MASKHYLVTGGTGFIGAGIVRRLVRRGDTVRVLDNNSRGAERRLEGVLENIELIIGDIRDPDTVNRATANIDCVIHLAYVNGTRHFYESPDLVLDVGVRGMLNVLDGCRKNNVSELILASSSEVYQTPPTIPTSENVPMSIPDPLNPRYSYGGGKIISELMAINYGRRMFERVMIFRPHNVYGPDMGIDHVIPEFALRMKSLKETNGQTEFQIQGDGSTTRAFIYIDDFCNAVESIIDHGQHLEIYNIGTEKEVSIKSIAFIMAKHFNTDITLSNSALPAGGTNRRCPDISKIRALGFEPQFELQNGIQQTAVWYDNNAILAKTGAT